MASFGIVLGVFNLLLSAAAIVYYLSQVG